jgi:cellulose synthase/poly-beta-1,6-N-acetylglucosamine synthase-like glycosyltransferase
MIWFYWISGIALALIWLVPVIDTALHRHLIADITRPEWNPSAPTNLPSLTIVVPARNEEAEIEEALRSLLALDYPQLEIIAINDRSTDSTGAIMDRVAAEPASQSRLRVVHVRELPPRWLGKTHAMWLGAQQGTGEWILFTDADCVFRPDAMRRAMFYAAKNSLAHLVLIPTVHMHSWGERMMISFPQIAAGFVMRPWKVRDPQARDFMGAGAFNLVRREAYESIGTFAALRLEVVDDLKLGESIKKARFCQDVVIGRDLVSLRWIKGAMGLVRNLEKNLFAFLQFRLSLVIAACVAVLFLNLWPFLGVFIAPGWSRLPFAVAVALIAARYYQSADAIGVPAITFLLNPVSAVLTAFAIVGSAFAAIRDGGVTWRGTKYPLQELRKK